MTRDTAPLSAKSSRCLTCREYLERRVHVLVPHIVRTAHEHGADPRELAKRYVRSVHARHRAGLSLDPGAGISTPAGAA